MRVRIEAEALDVREGEQPPPLAAYAFEPGGRLVARQDLKPGGGNDLSIPGGEEPREIRLLIGPGQLQAEEDHELLAELTRIGAEELALRPGLDRDVLRVPLDRTVWWCWLKGLCVVRGKLLKKVTSGGIAIDLPVCDAEIEIYEVDPIHVILPKVPDLVLDRLREVIRKPPPPWPPEKLPGGLPFPPVPPGPGPDPAPMFVQSAGPSEQTGFPHFLTAPADTAAATSAGDEAELRELELDDDAAGERLFRFEAGESGVADLGERTAALRALSQEPALVTAAQAGIEPLRSALLRHPDLLRPLLCFIWPVAVTMQKVATATTDDCGRFRAIFSRGCSSDVPDLYFKAFRRIGFLRIPILAPLPVACHTWWNYACGTEVTLYTSSPFALTCPPCPPVIAPPRWVLVMAVGNTSLANIRGASSALPASPLGLTGSGAPFGGLIRFRVEFDNTLRTDLNVRYYRLRWRKAGTMNPFVPVTGDAFRHYAHMVGSQLFIEPYKLGQQAVGSTPNLFEIPPPLPPIGQWVIADAVVDTTSGSFDSVGFAPPAAHGLYEFELTLFDGGGNAVNANALGIGYRVPATTDLTSTIPTDDAASLGLVTPAGRFVFTLHVDNNVCSAAIAAPTISGTPATDGCGLLEYGSTSDVVTLEYNAAHPNGFADYSFRLTRGIVDQTPPGSDGPVGPAPGLHTATDTVGNLMNGCVVAGFAETLWVSATATDGWRRLNEYDRGAVRAFVLSPEGLTA